MTNSLAELIAEIEGATEGSRELDEKIAGLEYATSLGEMFIGGNWVEIPAYSDSLDAALKLVEPHWNKPTISGGPKGWWVCIDTGEEVFEADAATPALALTLACLKARQTTAKE